MSTIRNNQYRGAPSKAQGDIQTFRVPFIGSESFRGTSTSKDQRFVNGFFDPIKNPITESIRYYFTKRPGSTRVNQPSGGAATGRGCQWWRGKLYSVFGTQLYSGVTNLGVTLTTSSGICGFAATRPGAGTQYLGINDGARLYLISTTDVVTTVVTMPANTGSLVYFDTYWFVITSNNIVYNCNADDPTTWDAAKNIPAQMMNGIGIGLAHQNNTILAFSTNQVQAFYDNANASGSPLNNIEQAMQQVGCAAVDSITSDENTVTWVGSSEDGGFTVYLLSGTTNLKEIADPPLRRVLDAETSSITTCNGKSLRVSGKSFYILKLTSSNRTFVYDYELGFWCEWSSPTNTALPFVDYTFGTYNSSEYKLYACHATDGYIYELSTAAGQDNSVSFTVLARTSRLDFDTMNRKFCHRLELIGDTQSSTTNVSLSYYDDDYVTAATARTLDMSVSRPFASNLGNFRRRAWSISYTGANPFRVESMELKLRLGDD